MRALVASPRRLRAEWAEPQTLPEAEFAQPSDLIGCETAPSASMPL